MGHRGGHRGPIPVGCAVQGDLHEWDWDGEWDQERDQGMRVCLRQRAGVQGCVTQAGRTRRWQCDACAPRGPAGRRSPVRQNTSGARGAEPRSPRNRGQGCHRGGWRLREDVAAGGLRQRGLPQGQEDYDRLRPLSYSDANVVLMCFDVTDSNSFDNILTKWYPEVNHFCKGVPVLLVGCKTDLRQDQEVLQKLKDGRIEPVSRQQGEAMARQVRAVSYMECSARYQDNVENIFVTACSAAISAARRRQRKAGPRRVCAIL